MTIPFFKYHGTGNDFVIIDNRPLFFPKQDRDLIAALCHRRFGIGADGLILLEDHDELDFEMIYYNADGNTSSMCGNGGRCIVAFAHEMGFFEKETAFMAIDGVHHAVYENNIVSLKMIDVPAVQNLGKQAFFVDTGSPHYVAIKQSENFIEDARKIRYSKEYKQNGVNVNFIQINDDSIDIRTYERGVENETYSCGTGAVAAALVYFKKTKKREIQLNTKGGVLKVSAEKTSKGFQNIYLEGPAVQLFYSEINTSLLNIK